MGKQVWQSVRKNGLGFALTWVIICGYVRLTSHHWPSPGDLLWGIVFSLLVIIVLPYLIRVVSLRRQGMGSAAPRNGILPSRTRSGPETDLQTAVQHFIEAADTADFAEIAATYDADFQCVRVADAGGFVHLDREQMMQFWNSVSTPTGSGGHAVATRDTTIHHIEMVGETGFVLMTRTKDLGSGWEPLFYTLVWKKQAAGWRLMREFVHQKTVPQWR